MVRGYRFGLGSAVSKQAGRVALTAGVIGLLVAALGLAAREGDLSRFVVAGELNVEAALAPPDLAVQGGSGYDGQFYYRLAIQPLSRGERVAGVRFDLPSVRQQRIVYPLLAGLVGGFDPGRVPSTLLAVNLVALGALGGVAALRMQQLGRPAWWGLMVAVYPGFLISLLFDLAEIVAMTFALGGLVALAARRWWWAGGLLCLAGLTRETTLLLPVTGLLAWAWARLHRSEHQAPVWTYMVPVGVGVGWQVAILIYWGSLPAVSGASLNLGLPFSGLMSNLRQAIVEPTGTTVTSVLVAAAMWVMVALMARSLRRSAASTVERVAWLAAVGLMSLLTTFMYSGPQHFLRAFTEAYVLGWLIMAGDPLFEAHHAGSGAT